KWQEIQGTLKKIDTDQSIVFDYVNPAGKTYHLNCPAGMATYLFLGNESEYLGAIGNAAGRRPEIPNGHDLEFIRWHRDSEKTGYLDGRRVILRHIEGRMAAGLLPEHYRADATVRSWRAKGDKKALELKYTWTP